jgi:hypothetical protein
MQGSQYGMRQLKSCVEMLPAAQNAFWVHGTEHMHGVLRSSLNYPLFPLKENGSMLFTSCEVIFIEVCNSILATFEQLLGTKRL